MENPIHPAAFFAYIGKVKKCWPIYKKIYIYIYKKGPHKSRVGLYFILDKSHGSQQDELFGAVHLLTVWLGRWWNRNYRVIHMILLAIFFFFTKNFSNFTSKSMFFKYQSSFMFKFSSIFLQKHFNSSF